MAARGGNGDDRITLFNTTIDASVPPPSNSSVGVLLFGETSANGPTSGTGNDFIEMSNTTIVADSGESSALLRIYGEQNAGGNITGGNDHINLSNTVIRATSESFEGNSGTVVQIFGDDNTAGTLAPTSVIGQGNDWIDVNGTSIIADSAQGQGVALVQIYGDQNQAFGTGTATIGNFAAKTGGDDTINVTNTTVSASGANFSQNSVFVDIEGEFNRADVATATATVGNGNDTITVDNFDVNSNGTMSDNSADLGIFGDGDYFTAGLNNFGRIGRGNDTIYVQNCDVTGTGTLNNAATLILYSDDRTQQGENGTTVLVGTDNVQLSSFLLHAPGGTNTANVQLHTQKGNDVVDVLTIDVTGLAIDTGTGDDDVDVLNSDWDGGNLEMGAGNDLLKMNGNTFGITTADGDLGFDTLNAHSNTGVLLPTGFESVNIS